MIGETLQLLAGTDGIWTQTLRNSDGTPYTLFTGSETFVCKLWAGGDRTPITPAPSAQWLDAGAGKYTLRYPLASNAALEAGTYRLQVMIVAGSNTFGAFNGGLKKVGGPGSASSLSTYCNLSDMKRQHATIDRLLDPEDDEEGAARQCHAARLWLERLGNKHFAGTPTMIRSDRFFSDSYWNSGVDDPYLQQLFDADALILTSDVVDAAACYACAQLLMAQTEGKEAEGYRMDGARLAAKADALASMLTLQLDTNADGRADVAIPLGVSVRRNG